MANVEYANAQIIDQMKAQHAREVGTAEVEPIVRVQPSRFGLTPLQQFARAGLDLKIGDFRQMCMELCDQGMGDTAHDVADVLFAWMTIKLEDER